MKKNYVYIPVSKAKHLHLERFPSTGPHGNITGMRKLYWGNNAYIVKSGAYTYCVDEITFRTAIASK